MSNRLIQLFANSEINLIAKLQLRCIIETWFQSNENNYNISILYIKDRNNAKKIAKNEKPLCLWSGNNIKLFLEQNQVEKNEKDLFIKIHDEFSQINIKNNNFILITITPENYITDIYPKSFRKFWPSVGLYELYKYIRNNKTILNRL